MPTLSVWALRAAVAHFAIGWTLGALMLLHKGASLGDWAPELLPWHLHAMLFGWTVQVVIGVGYWILPKFVGEEGFRGNTGLAAASLVALNASVLLAVVPGVPFIVPSAGEALAAALFGMHLWPRVKSFGS